jgi:hypothetical protein
VLCEEQTHHAGTYIAPSKLKSAAILGTTLTPGTDRGRLAPASYNAAPRTAAEFRFEPNGELLVQEAIIDWIAHTERPGSLQPQQWHQRCVGAALASVATSAYPTGIPRLQALFRTLMVDRVREETREPRLDESRPELLCHAASCLCMLPGYARNDSFIPLAVVEAEDKPDYVLGLLQFLEKDSDCMSSKELLGTYFGMESLFPDQEPDLFRGRRNMMAYTLAEGSATKHRNSFSTEKGYVVLTSSNIRDGDSVCLVGGCRLPPLSGKMEGISSLGASASYWG